MAIVPTPLAWLVLAGVYPVDRMQSGYVETYGEGLAEFMALCWPVLLVLLVVCGVFAWLAFRRQRRLRQPSAVAWAVFVGVFGPIGYLAYRWHRPGPPVVECPTCGKRVPRNRDDCAACSAEFPAPSPLGIEVFA
jgi:hypothetical protein